MKKKTNDITANIPYSFKVTLDGHDMVFQWAIVTGINEDGLRVHVQTRGFMDNFDNAPALDFIVLIKSSTLSYIDIEDEIAHFFEEQETQDAIRAELEVLHHLQPESLESEAV